MTDQQRGYIERLLTDGVTASEIAAKLHVSRQAVAAVRAHMTMRASRVGRSQRQSANLPTVALVLKTGHEPFHRHGAPLKLRLLDFWRWCDSDLIGNAVRGRLAEYLVAIDIGAANGVRSEWVAYDLKTPEGHTVEVKSASYIQTWAQRRNSTISFDTRPTLGWDPDTAEFGGVRRRQSRAYVFALLKHDDRETIDPLDVGQWVFHVIRTSVLDTKLGDQKSVSLSRLLTLKPQIVSFGEVGAAIRAELGREPSALRK